MADIGGVLQGSFPVRYIQANTKPGDVREIVIYADRKLRRFDDGTGHGWLDTHWVLYRRDVPNLTDQEWYSAPSGEGWREYAD